MVPNIHAVTHRQSSHLASLAAHCARVAIWLVLSCVLPEGLEPKRGAAVRKAAEETAAAQAESIMTPGIVAACLIVCLTVVLVKGARG